MSAGPTRARPRAPPRNSWPWTYRSRLPAIGIEPEWKAQQRLWGHSFHPMCSYLASFPAALTHAFIARYSRPGDVVLDPFSGRGTTPLQACAEGRIGVGNDLNPFAHLLTASKVEPATRAGALTRLTQLRLGWNADAASLECTREPRDRRSVGDPRAGRWVAWRRVGRFGARARRGRAGLPPRHPRPAAVRPLRRCASTIGRTVPGCGDHRDPARQERELPLRAHAEHVQHGPALRPRFRGAERVRVAAPRRLRWAWRRSSTACSGSRAPSVEGDRTPRRCP